MENIVRKADERELNYLFAESATTDMIIKGIADYRKVKFISVIEDGNRLMGYERRNKDLLILFCRSIEVANKTFKNISEMLNDTYKINHKATLRDLTIELI